MSSGRDKTAAELLEHVAWKKQLAAGKKLFETTQQAPPPSKDFIQMLVTEKGVIFRRFPISLRGVTQGAVLTPTEKLMTLEDFKLDHEFQEEVKRNFGSAVLEQVSGMPWVAR